jgi:hypothetical protein
MTVVPYVLAVASALLTLYVVVELLRRRRLRERHALWWFIAGILALIVGLVPSILVWAADLVGVVEPLNLVFFTANAILFLVCLQHSAELTTIEAKLRSLAEHTAMLELRLRELESRASAGESAMKEVAEQAPVSLPASSDDSSS